MVEVAAVAIATAAVVIMEVVVVVVVVVAVVAPGALLLLLHRGHLLLKLQHCLVARLLWRFCELNVSLHSSKPYDSES
jgi:hypothetical protein